MHIWGTMLVGLDILTDLRAGAAGVPAAVPLPLCAIPAIIPSQLRRSPVVVLRVAMHVPGRQGGACTKPQRGHAQPFQTAGSSDVCCGGAGILREGSSRFQYHLISGLGLLQQWKKKRAFRKRKRPISPRTQGTGGGALEYVCLTDWYLIVTCY